MGITRTSGRLNVSRQSSEGLPVSSITTGMSGAYCSLWVGAVRNRKQELGNVMKGQSNTGGRLPGLASKKGGKNWLKIRISGRVGHIGETNRTSQLGAERKNSHYHFCWSLAHSFGHRNYYLYAPRRKSRCVSADCAGNDTLSGIHPIHKAPPIPCAREAHSCHGSSGRTPLEGVNGLSQGTATMADRRMVSCLCAGTEPHRISVVSQQTEGFRQLLS